MAHSPGFASRLLPFVVAGYLLAGVCYALFTPAWQAPDEPAHYNYVGYLVEKHRLPVLQMGDYPHEYLEQLKAKRFPPEMSIDPLRYEFHQPPLYYLLATVVYRLTSGSLLALRLLSLLLGAGLLLVAWALVRAIFPDQPALAAGTTAFVAFLPMHVAMTSAVNNDALAELLLASSVLGLVRYLRASVGAGLRPAPTGPAGLGVLIGLGLVTKITAFIALPLALMAILMAPRNKGERTRDALLIFGLAGLLLLPWLARNHLTYGGLDLLGLRRHDQIVVGQPRTAEWLAQMGWTRLCQAFAETTFRSFWGQFGWMGVLLDARLYLLLEVLSGLVILGGLLFAVRNLRPASQCALEQSGPEGYPLFRPTRSQWRLLALLSAWLVLVFLSYVWWNLQFVQHQGRYFFSALIPLGLIFALGLAEVLCRPHAWLVSGFCLGSGLLLLVKGLLTGQCDKWAIAFMFGAGVVWLGRGLLSREWDRLVNGMPYVGLFALDFICLFRFIVPGLG